MRSYPFQGTLYARRGAGALATAPYDQIDDAERDRLHRIDHHFSHLTRPATSSGSPAARAAAVYGEWKREGVVRRDDEPRFYACAIDLSRGERRLGLFGMIGIEDPSSGVIRPHERTVDKTVAERLELLRATRVDLEPILLLADDEGRLETLLRQDLDRYAPVASHTDSYGDVHHLVPLPSGRNDAYRAALAPATGVIADGHHRYRTAGLFAREERVDAGTAAAAKLAVVTSLASPALTIDPIHRGLPRLPPEDLPPGVLERRPAAAADGSRLAREAAEAAAGGAPALGYRAADGAAEIWALDPGAGPADLPEAASRLAVVLLHHAVLPAFGLGPETATDGTVRYRSDADRLWTDVERGEVACGVWLPPMSAESFQGAVAEGDLLPPKSTRFLPKVISGLVWCDHDATLG